VIVEIELAGRRRAVDVRPEGDGWIVVVDGRRLAASVAEAGGRWSLLVREAGSRTSRSYEIAFEARGAECIVHVDGEAIALAIVDPRAGTWQSRGRAGAGRGAAGRAASSNVTAPMPGRVVKVLVAPGDVVAPRQGIVVVEAMKMENELRAPQAGTVREVRVSEGMSVEANTVLVVVE